MNSPIKKDRRARSDALMSAPEVTFDDIIETIVSGVGGLHKWAQLRNVPYTRFKFWIDADPERRRRYEEALIASADAHVAIAQALMETEPKLLDNGAVDNGWVNWRKTQAEFHRWLSGRLMPRRYGDSVEVVSRNYVEVNIRDLLNERELQLRNMAADSGILIEQTPIDGAHTRACETDLFTEKEHHCAFRGT